MDVQCFTPDKSIHTNLDRDDHSDVDAALVDTWVCASSFMDTVGNIEDEPDQDAEVGGSPHAREPTPPAAPFQGLEKASYRTGIMTLPSRTSLIGAPPEMERIQEISQSDSSEHSGCTLSNCPNASRADAVIYGFGTDFCDQDLRLKNCVGYPFTMMLPGAEADYSNIFKSQTPYQIPKDLMPLPDILRNYPINMLYFHHFLHYTAGLLVAHDCPANPFTTILPQSKHT